MKKMLAFILAAALALLPGCNTPAPQAETSQEAPACTLELAGEGLALEPRQEADGVHIPLEMASGEHLTLTCTATPGCQVREAVGATGLVGAVVGEEKLILTAGSAGTDQITVTCGGEGYQDCTVILEVNISTPVLPLIVTCAPLPQAPEGGEEGQLPEETPPADALAGEEEPEGILDPAIRYEDGKLALPVAASCALLLEAPEETVYTLTAPEGEAAAEVSLHPEGYLAITGLEVGSCAFTLEASHPDWIAVTLAVEVQVSLPALLVTPEAEGFLLDAPSLEQGKNGYRLTLAGLPEEAKVELRQDNENVAFSLVKDQLSISPKAVGVTKLNLDISCEGFQPLSLEYEFEVTTTKAALTLNGGKSAATVWVEGSISLPIALGVGAELLLDYPKELVEVERVGNTLSVKGIAPGTAVLSATARKEGLADNLQRVTITVTPHQAVSITLGNRSLAGIIGQSQGVRVTTNPADAKVTISGGGSIADCRYSGGVLTVTPFAPGSATIAVTASKAGYTTSTAYIALTVAAQAGKITLWTSPTYLNLTPGKEGSFAVYATPKDAELEVDATSGFDCQLSGQRVTVTAPDKITTGTVTVTASKEGYPKASVAVRVAVTRPAVNLTLSPASLSLKPGKNGTATISVTPADAKLSVTASREELLYELSGKMISVTAPADNKSGFLTITATAEGLEPASRKLYVSVVRPSGADLDLAAEAKEVFRLVNIERQKAGLSTVVWDSSFAACAQIRAEEMTIFFSHERPYPPKDTSIKWPPNVPSVGGIYNAPSVADEQGVPHNWIMENGGAGYTSAAAAVEGWMKSSGHRANILKASHRRCGVGVYYDANSATGYGTGWALWFDDYSPSTTRPCTACTGCTNTASDHHCSRDPANCYCPCEACQRLRRGESLACITCPGCTNTKPNHGCNANPLLCTCPCDACKKLRENPACTLCPGCTNTKPNHGCTGDPATCTCTCDLCKTLGNFYRPCTLCSGCTATGPNHGCTGDPRTCYCTCDGCKKLKEDFQNSLPCLVCTDCTKTGSNHGCTGDPATCTCDCAGCEKWRQLESSKPDPTPEPQPEPEPTPEPEPEPQPEPQPEPEPEPTPEPTPEPPPAEGEATPPADGSGETPAP